MRLFRRNLPKPVPLRAPNGAFESAVEVAPESDALPPELASIIGSATITVRIFEDGDEDRPAIIHFNGYGMMAFNKDALAEQFLKMSPGLTQPQIDRATRFLNNRIVEEARRQGGAAITDRSYRPRGRWAAWRPDDWTTGR